jgi:hypothetical protein
MEFSKDLDYRYFVTEKKTITIALIVFFMASYEGFTP